MQLPFRKVLWGFWKKILQNTKAFVHLNLAFMVKWKNKATRSLVYSLPQAVNETGYVRKTVFWSDEKKFNILTYMQKHTVLWKTQDLITLSSQ